MSQQDIIATQFQPGQSGNPAGKPKGTKSLSTIIKKLGDNPPDWDTLNIANIEKFKNRFKNKNVWEAIVLVAIAQAMTGDDKARQWLADRAYGRSINISAEGQIDVVHIFKPEKLTAEQFNQIGAEQRKITHKVVEAEIIDGSLESPTRASDLSITSP